MNDNEIVKALECCLTEGCADCQNCPYESACDIHDNKMLKDTLDLINRLQAENSNLTSDLTSLQRKLTSANAEIEKLLKHNEYILMQHAFQRRPDGSCWNDVIEKAKSEARKEFAERIKEKLRDLAKIDFKGGYYYLIGEAFFDNLLIELDGKENENA